MKLALTLSTLAALAPLNFAQGAPPALEAPVATEQDLIHFISNMEKVAQIFEGVTNEKVPIAQ